MSTQRVDHVISNKYYWIGNTSFCEVKFSVFAYLNIINTFLQFSSSIKLQQFLKRFCNALLSTLMPQRVHCH